MQLNNVQTCKYRLGEQVTVTGFIGLLSIYNNTIQYNNVYNKVGVITRSEVHINTQRCIYNIKFIDNMYGIDVPEILIARFVNALYTPPIQTYFNVNKLITAPSVDVSQNERLQEDVINYYHKKILEWIKNKDIEFTKFKKHNKLIKSKKGIEYVEIILKLFLKKNKQLKWYDLRHEDNKDNVREFIREKLSAI